MVKNMPLRTGFPTMIWENFNIWSQLHECVLETRHHNIKNTIY